LNAEFLTENIGTKKSGIDPGVPELTKFRVRKNSGKLGIF
jgi:hypothetical protein